MQGIPYIPENITVHLGKPDSDALNITLPFPEYVKNVASSEIYPTWPENALRANIYVIVTYALNRIYTEWYRSRGYDFDITDSTQYDQAFVANRDIFENISILVDELFNSYLTMGENVEPFFTAFCNGTTVTCEGLSQWGTVELANQGLTPYEILKYYYGNNINIVRNAPVKTNTPSFSGEILRLGSAGNDIQTIQVQLNRISRDYPSIPKIPEPNAIFGKATEDAVKEFQRIFGLPVTGVVNSATWYKIAYIYVSVKKLSELTSEGISLEDVNRRFETELRIGMQSPQVKLIQYYLAVIGAYYRRVNPVDITGYFGEMTENSVKSFQQVFGLSQTGVVDRTTWNTIYDAYDGIISSIPYESSDVVLYPNIVLKEGMTSEYVRIIQQYLSFIHETFPDIPAVNDTGYFGALTKNAVIAFQNKFGLTPNGAVGVLTWNEIASLYSDLKFGENRLPYQHPGYIIE